MVLWGRLIRIQTAITEHLLKYNQCKVREDRLNPVNKRESVLL